MYAMWHTVTTELMWSLNDTSSSEYETPRILAIQLD